MQKNCAISNALCANVRKNKLLLLLAVIVVIGAIVFAVLFSRPEPEEYTNSRNVFLDHITINGIDVGGMTYNDALDAVVYSAQQQQSSWKLDIICNDFVYSTLTYNTLGSAVDYAAVESALRQAWQYGHTGGYKEYKADAEQLQKSPFEAQVPLTQGSAEQVEYVLGIIAENIYIPPVDAQMLSFNPENKQSPFEFRYEEYGRRIDTESAKNDIMQMADSGVGGKYEISILPIEPSVRWEELSQNVKLLATGKNSIDKYSTAERNDNIALAMSKINGIVLENGETFSFNSKVGNRSAENGYKPALGYVSGEMVEVVGGGVCQVSTTLYSAALCAGLTITDRTPHSMPVSYIELGQDATVNYMRGHMIDLKFKNETGHPVYITAGIEKNEIGRSMSVVRIYGWAPEEDIHYRVESIVTETLPIPAEKVVRKDTDKKYVKYTDEKHISSKGSEGHVVETYLEKLRGSIVVERKLISTDIYKAQPVIEYVGVEKRQ